MVRATANKTLVRMQTTLRFVCAVQLGRYVPWKSQELEIAQRGPVKNE